MILLQSFLVILTLGGSTVTAPASGAGATGASVTGVTGCAMAIGQSEKIATKIANDSGRLDERYPDILE